MTKLYRDLVSGCQPRTAGQGGVQQLQKALRLLRERLSASDQEAMVSDATTMIVVILAMHAQMVGDQEFARHHVKGLHRIIDLRGGISSFEAGNTKLLIESLRYEILFVSTVCGLTLSKRCPDAISE